MVETNGAFASVNINLCESIFYRHQLIHLMAINFSSSLMNAPPHMLLGLACCDKNLFRNFDCKKGVDFALVACRITNWAYVLKYK